MSWGSYAHLSGAIELAQAATVKIGGGTAAELAVAAADHSLNTTNIDLIGLSTLGIEYIPYG
tara:strand:- start:542 stop:727 length:186 start_codon:yes stop_codon:yes gene_type:complete